MKINQITCLVYFLLVAQRRCALPESCSPDISIYKKLKKNKSSMTLLGEGAFGNVYLYKNPTSGREIALKEVSLKHNRDVKSQEAVIMDKLKGYMFANGLYDSNSCFYDEKKLVLGSEVMIGDLDVYKKLKNSTLASSIIWMMMITRSMFNAINRLHSLDIIHRDIKPSNILLRNKFDVVLGDFGLATELPYKSYKAEDFKTDDAFVGTPFYMSPEVKFKTYYKETDIFAAGVTMMSIFTGFSSIKKIEEFHKTFKYPTYFDKKEKNWKLQMFKNVCSFSLWEIDTIIISIYCYHFNYLFTQMINYNPKERPIGRNLIDLFDAQVVKALNYIAHYYKDDFSVLEDIKSGKRLVSQISSKPTSTVTISLYFALQRFVTETQKYKELNPSYYVTLLQDNVIFFNHLECRGEKLLGKPIDIYIAEFKAEHKVEGLYDYEGNFKNVYDALKTPVIELKPKVSRSLKNFFGLLRNTRKKII